VVAGRAKHVVAMLTAGTLMLSGCASSSAPSATLSQSGQPPRNGSKDGARYTLAAAKIGTVLTYDVTDTSGTSAFTLTFISISAKPNGDIRLTVNNTVPGSKDESLTYDIGEDGSETIPWDKSFQPPVGYQIAYKSGAITIPGADVLAAGTNQTSTLTLREFNEQQSQDIVLNAVTKGAGVEDVTVPAGTFHTQVVKQTIVETAGDQHVEIALTYYLGADIATVKSVADVTSGGTTQRTTQVLLSIVRPGR
jgi:hypothetical protein